MKLKKISITSAIVFFCLLFPSQNSNLVFSASLEIGRTRSGSAAATSKEGMGYVVEGGSGVSTDQNVEYYIAPEDEMEIFVWQNPDLTATVIVGPDGYISYPLVGRIKVSGFTVSKLENILRDKLTEYVKNPQVSLIMKKFAGNKVVVLGEVTYPGIYTYKGSLDLTDALALAGDFTEEAHKDSVLIVHNIGTKEAKVKRINFVKLFTGSSLKPEDLLLRPNDVIFVPKTFIANFNKAMTDLNMVVNNANTGLQVRKEIRRLGRHDR
ncbi:MAG: polysaccharide export protein [Candidatus Omnitrophica bacterium]|nr:polysaccharide export protein [Candidatus Omnitrophota bacterium]